MSTQSIRNTVTSTLGSAAQHYPTHVDQVVSALEQREEAVKAEIVEAAASRGYRAQAESIVSAAFAEPQPEPEVAATGGVDPSLFQRLVDWARRHGFTD